MSDGPARDRCRETFGFRMLARVALILSITHNTSARAAHSPESPEPRDHASYYADRWTIADGLPQGSINDLLQTSDGALWIATFGGLVRFDGLEFRVFDIDTLAGLSSNRITALAADPDGGLWLTTEIGQLLRIHDDKVIEVHSVPGASDELRSLVRHASGSLWIQKKSGAVQRFAAGNFTELVPPGSGAEFHGLCLNHDGTISAAVGAELMVFTESGERLQKLPAPARILTVAAMSRADTWLGLSDGVARFRAGVLERVPTDPLVTGPVNAIGEDDRSGLWLGTSDGPTHFVPDGPNDTGVLVASQQPMPGGFEVRSVMRDRESNIWLGSNGQGLVRLKLQPLTWFDQTGSRASVSAVCGDGSDGAWVAEGCHGLTRVLSNGATRAEQRASDAANPCIHALLLDTRGRLWVGNSDILLRRDRDESSDFTLILDGRRFSPHVAAIAETARGEVWIASASGALVRVDAADAIVEELDLHEPIFSIAAGAEDCLWIGSAGSVFRLQQGRVQRFGAEAGVPRSDVHALLPDSNGKSSETAGESAEGKAGGMTGGKSAGSVWIATDGGGLGWLAGDRAFTISRAQGLPDSALSCILGDGSDRLWLLSNMGLIVADRAELTAVAEGRKRRIDPVVLGPEAGIQEASFGAPAGFRAPDGRLWFGTIAGVVRVDPAEFPFNRTPPTPRIEKLLADDVPLPLPLSLVEKLDVSAGTRRLTFEYTAFGLVTPERVHFRYRMRGFDDAWIENGAQRRAAYSALSPGPYVFEVMARNEDGVWSPAPAALGFEVLPSWWQTTIFRIGAVLATIAVLLLLHRWRLAIVRRRAQVLLEATEGRAQAEARESRLREDLAHVARVATAGQLATSLAHEVNQPLAAIVSNAQAGRRFLARGIDRAVMDEILSDIAQQGQRASDVIRRLREFLRKHPAEQRLVDVNAILRDTLPLVRRELDDHRVRVVLDLAGDLPPISADPVQIQQVVVNLVKNACEALAGIPGERRVELSTRAKNGNVELEVRDTGPGLTPDVMARLFQPFVTTKPDGMGMGLAICRSIVDAHEGRISAEAVANGGIAFRVVFPAASAQAVAT